MTTRKKIFITGLILAGLVVTVFLLLSSRKSAPAFDADLLPVRKSVTDQENAFPLLAKAASVSYWPKDKSRELKDLYPGKNWDADFAAEVLAKNGEALAMLERAMACAELQVPAPKGFDDAHDYLREWRNLSNLASIQSGKLFREGKGQAALELALRIIHLGHHAENAGGLVLHYLAGSAIKQEGLRQLRQIAWETSLPPEQLMACIAKLEPYRANAPGLTNAFKCEYHISATFFEDLRSGKLTATNSPFEQMAQSVSSSLTFDLNRTKNLMAQDARVRLRSIPRHFSDMPFSELFSYPTNSSKIQMVMNGNATGEILVGMSASSLTALLAKKCRENSAVSATQLSLALKCFYTKHGHLPEHLSDLVPEFLQTIPLDDFDGKPLRYSRERRLLWSVGNDLIDSGGVKSIQTGGPDDILFEIELKPAPAP